MNSKNKIEIVRLRDLTFKWAKHFSENRKSEKEITVGDLEEMDRDIIVWIKNFLLTLEELDAKADVTWIGD